jgi:GMP synthase (glutamine-hydrolysing)
MKHSQEKITTSNNMVLILDFGSQVTQLIARRIRELGVFCEVKNFNISLAEIKNINPRCLIFSGGPASVYEKNAPIIDREIFKLNLPIFGICYGEQLICHLMGGEVENSSQREFGYAQINIIEQSPLLSNIVNPQVWMSHGDHISKIPDGFKAIANTSKAPFAVIANEEKKIYGVQFHPEVIHSIDGKKIIENFVVKICGCQTSWSMKNFKDNEIQKIKNIVGNKKVICGLSGGVDSSVTASLISNAIGEQLTCIFVDHGLLRKNEAEEVCEIFSKRF